MTKLFLDTEFNGFGGELISMALVGEDGREFYEAIHIKEKIDPWVEKHVMPFLGVDTIDLPWFKSLLQNFLMPYNGNFTLVADWPDDIRYFCQALITAPGEMIHVPAFKVEMRRDLEGVRSEVPHNALYDARAIKASYHLVTA